MPRSKPEIAKKDRIVTQRAIRIASQIATTDDPIRIAKLNAALSILSIAASITNPTEYNRLIHTTDKL